VVPKNIPLKMADIKSSYDLEHLKQRHSQLCDTGASKKINMHLHKALKGDDSVVIKEKRQYGP
jgi:hypothetical protein